MAQFVRSFPQTAEFLDRVTDLMLYLLPHYVEEGKSYLTVAFGCTGGQHRSVMMAEEMAQRLKEAGLPGEGAASRHAAAGVTRFRLNSGHPPFSQNREKDVARSIETGRSSTRSS